MGLKTLPLSFTVHLLFLQSVLRKVNTQDAQQIASPIMEALLQMLSLGGGSASGVQEDALMAIGTLVEGLYINKHVLLFCSEIQ